MKSKINKIINNIKRTKLNSLKVKILIYLTIFAILILSFLWLFQIIFLDSFYEKTKVNEINKSSTVVKNGFKNAYDELFNTIDDLSKDKGICIQIISNTVLVYDSSTFNRGCLPENSITNYKNQFISSLLDEETYKVINPRYNNDVLIKAIKLDSNNYAFLSSSLEPLDNAIGILRKQLIFITIALLFFSFIIAFYISKKLSSPIENINESAKKMAIGNYDTIFYINEDIDELNELVKTLNKITSELSKTESLRRELMANVSHDLKTPLTMIKAYAEMVRDLTYKNKEKRNDNLNVIIEESDRLNSLVNDILDLSIIQSGNINLKCENFNLYELINNIIRRYNILEQTKNYNFIVNCNKDLIVFGDPLRIEQVIYNLVNNAINYTGIDKKIIIDVIENINFVKVEIIDTGKGIKEEELDLIFKKYYKVDKTHRRDKVGTGIGLSIVENILKEHGYKYGVNSKINKGTTFWFMLPKGK